MRQRPIRILPSYPLLSLSLSFRNLINTTLGKLRDPKISA